jgi:gluconolactonase
VAEGLKFPNGMALSADEGTLYCAQTSGADVMAFPVLPGGRLGPGRRYGPQLGRLSGPEGPGAHADLGYTDGVGLDADGALWVCLPADNRVVAILPDGQVETVVHDPSGQVINHPTNVTWGGPDLKDLYIGSIRADYVLKARSPVAGQPMLHQR